MRRVLFRLTCVAQKRLCLSSQLFHHHGCMLLTILVNLHEVNLLILIILIPPCDAPNSCLIFEPRSLSLSLSL